MIHGDRHLLWYLVKEHKVVVVGLRVASRRIFERII